MAIEDFYRIKAKDFNEIADKLESEFNDTNFIGHEKYVWGMRDVRAKAKYWYDEVKFTAYQNNVDIGNRKTFSKVLKSQIDAATEEKRNEYALYLKAILNFLEFYYRCF